MGPSQRHVGRQERVAMSPPVSIGVPRSYPRIYYRGRGAQSTSRVRSEPPSPSNSPVGPSRTPRRLLNRSDARYVSYYRNTARNPEQNRGSRNMSMHTYGRYGSAPPPKYIPGREVREVGVGRVSGDGRPAPEKASATKGRAGNMVRASANPPTHCISRTDWGSYSI